MAAAKASSQKRLVSGAYVFRLAGHPGFRCLSRRSHCRDHTVEMTAKGPLASDHRGYCARLGNDTREWNGDLDDEAGRLPMSYH